MDGGCAHSHVAVRGGRTAACACVAQNPEAGTGGGGAERTSRDCARMRCAVVDMSLVQEEAYLRAAAASRWKMLQDRPCVTVCEEQQIASKPCVEGKALLVQQGSVRRPVLLNVHRQGCARICERSHVHAHNGAGRARAFALLVPRVECLARPVPCSVGCAALGCSVRCTCAVKQTKACASRSTRAGGPAAAGAHGGSRVCSTGRA